ncbi:hypothetical protein BDK51DRAFT_46786 [Blyttiomyces helicus]|uniref:Fork-head domain-containing protein n=1 Tax=Blyttiomyces helicus TaxID=388810 RepID=A0A4P9WFF0_9FUNG|nr:hypothetical protein BDK51DRAFT_46786 [Blyttiomyces helicus]|eukprot:RKO90575.1 hypothetical protein BDK51DRAFT_46786 [Blyttiomyces helicus]
MPRASKSRSKRVGEPATTKKPTVATPLPALPPGVSRPAKSYEELIIEAMATSRSKLMFLRDIYEEVLTGLNSPIQIMRKYEYFRLTDKTGWRNLVRHNLSRRKTFVKLPRPVDFPGPGNFWTSNRLLDEPTIEYLRSSAYLSDAAETFQTFDPDARVGRGATVEVEDDEDVEDNDDDSGDDDEEDDDEGGYDEEEYDAGEYDAEDEDGEDDYADEEEQDAFRWPTRPASPTPRWTDTTAPQETDWISTLAQPGSANLRSGHSIFGRDDDAGGEYAAGPAGMDGGRWMPRVKADPDDVLPPLEPADDRGWDLIVTYSSAKREFEGDFGGGAGKGEDVSGWGMLDEGRSGLPPFMYGFDAGVESESLFWESGTSGLILSSLSFCPRLAGRHR